IARELHDETSQSLASLVANLEAVAGMLPAAEGKANARLRKAQSISISILDGIHKIIHELRPTLLDDLGLVAAIRWLADNNLGAVGVKVRLETVGRERRLPSEVEIALFRVVQEAVSNIARHGNAKNAALSLHFQNKAVQVRIQDDGKGFDVQDALSSKDRPRGLGLLGMKERIELVNGTLSIRSHIGSGTTISLQIPLRSNG
ncbi:MAG: sensor histidine kinase, partial [Dehalococcoidia bacterium]|nr:sensor histidine kinase [Dehalococcoidia bacterium]